jgi:hypothetical protein
VDDSERCKLKRARASVGTQFGRVNLIAVLSAASYIQHSPTLPSTVTNVNGVAHTENAIHRTPLYRGGSLIVAYSGFERANPNKIFQSANCATGPITCWNTIPACQPDGGLSAAFYIQQQLATLSQPQWLAKCRLGSLHLFTPKAVILVDV